MGKQFRKTMATIAFWLTLFTATPAHGQSTVERASIDAYVAPYVTSNNFSGVVLVEQDGRIVFEKAYGFANREQRVRNTPQAQFHIASMSMQHTAMAILRLVDQGVFSLDTPVASLVEGIQGGDKITVRHLLQQRSGLPDINALPAYADILNAHQNPATLVAAIKGLPLLFEPGSKYLHEEHSAYNLLALIIEEKTGLPFPRAIEKLVSHPLGLSSTLADDDSQNSSRRIAKGYQPEGVQELRAAPSIHWSAKAGNASIYTTVRDHALLVDAQFNGGFLSPTSRSAVLDTSQKPGYGWFRAPNARFNEVAYYMNGRAPGFASFVLHLPAKKLTVIVLSNIYSSATTTMGNDIAAIALHLPFKPFKPSTAPATTAASLGAFKFGPDFYQPNAQLTLEQKNDGVFLHWPSETTALIPTAPDHFIDRSYWVEAFIERDERGSPTALVYDGFRGTAER